MKTVLLTGGAGYIGSHIAVSLLVAGYEVVIVDNFSNSHKSTLSKINEVAKQENPASKEVHLVCCNLDQQGDLPLLRACFSVYDIYAVIHLAAYKSVPESLTLPLQYYQNNLISLLNVLQVMHENKVHRLLFSSSACVYGDGAQVPVGTVLTENDTAVPLNPYGHTKAMGEQICSDVAKAWLKSDPENTSVIVARYANPISCHPSGLLPETPRGPAMNLYNVISEVLAGKREKLSIFGSDYLTRDGTGQRDFIHVSDCSEAHVAIINHMTAEKKEPFEHVNIGTGKGTTVLELLVMIEGKKGVTIPYEMGERRPGDAASIVVSGDKMWQLFGWTASRRLDE